LSISTFGSLGVKTENEVRVFAEQVHALLDQKRPKPSGFGFEGLLAQLMGNGWHHPLILPELGAGAGSRFGDASAGQGLVSERAHDISNHLSRPFHPAVKAFTSWFGKWRGLDLGYRLAAVSHENRLAGFSNPFQDGQAGGLELGDGNRFHGISLPEFTGRIERLEQATPADLERWADRILDARHLEDVFATG
jgi:hypothetical protein